MAEVEEAGALVQDVDVDGVGDRFDDLRGRNVALDPVVGEESGDDEAGSDDRHQEEGGVDEVHFQGSLFDTFVWKIDRKFCLEDSRILLLLTSKVFIDEDLLHYFLLQID